MIGNRITLPTWNRLNVNHTNIDIEKYEILPYRIRSKNDIVPKEILEEISNYPHGFSVEENNDMNDKQNYSCFVHAKQGEKIKLKLIKLPCNKENNVLVDSHTLVAEKDADVEIIYDYYNEDEFESFRHSEIKIVARENAKVKVYYIQRNNENSIAIQSISALAYKNANVDVVEIEAGSKKTYFNFRASLIGDESNVDTSAVYLGSKDEYLNLFYNFDQYGKKTNSNVMIKGALKDRASKIFKASLDFKKGSTGSVGNEEEIVTLLSDEVHSVAVPLLLCTEDDVVGNHASSAGRIDQDMLFYIMSRGISQKEGEKLIIESNILPTIQKIPDAKLRSEVWDLFERKLSYE